MENRPQDMGVRSAYVQAAARHKTWISNGFPMEAMGKAILWSTKAGKYFLAIAKGKEKVLDYVYFEVRGPETD